MSNAAFSNFCTSSSGYIVWVGQFDAFVGAQSVFLDNNVQTQMHISLLTASGRIQAFNFDGSTDVAIGASTAAALNVNHVIVWKHTGGNLSCSVDGGTEVTVASGNTANMTGGFYLARLTSAGFDGKFLELYVWNTVPSSGDQVAIINQAKTYAGI
jgi:hypothetical protein